VRPSASCARLAPLARLRAGLLLALAATACGAPRVENAGPVAGVRRPVPPFGLASSRDAVVRVLGDVICSGTLIADDRVLTARQCVVTHGGEGGVVPRDRSPEQITVELGGDDLPWGEARVRAVVAPECSETPSEGDIAILVLSRHLAGLPVGKVRLDRAPQRREDVSILGFGRCALSAYVLHRSQRDAGPVDFVSSGHFMLGASLCPRDAGAPVFGGGEVIGVASTRPAGDGTLVSSMFTRVDVWPLLFSVAVAVSEGVSPVEPPAQRGCRILVR